MSLVTRVKPFASSCGMGARPTQVLRSTLTKRSVVVYADKKDSAPTQAPSEDRLEALEGAIKGKTAPKKSIPIRNMTAPTKASEESNMAEWKEGQLFPEGWDKMNIFEKTTELYMGRRGVLFWANKVAYASAIGLLGAWVLFRIVGPNLGLYQLAGDVTVPQF